MIIIIYGKKFLKKAFTKFGAVAIPMHMAMWGISYNLAKKFKIPYIFWGENSAREYDGSKKALKLNMKRNCRMATACKRVLLFQKFMGIKIQYCQLKE